MEITASQLKQQTNEILKRAAAGEEFTVKIGENTSARIVPAGRYNIKRRREAIRDARALRGEIAKKGKKITARDIRAATEEARK